MDNNKTSKGGIDWQGKVEHESGSNGSGNGKRSSDSDEPTRSGGTVPYDIEYERKEAQKYPPLPPVKMQKQDKTMKDQSSANVMSLMDFQEKNKGTEPRRIPRHFQPYDYHFEKKCGQESEPTGTDGYFYNRNWMQIGIDLVEVAAERPLLLFTQKTGNAPGTKCGVAHENHPFVAMVHLLKEADVGSTVYMSMPYVTDKQVMDELCHFAQPQDNDGRDLKINIILWETEDNKDFINQDFLAGRNDILDACQRLNIRSTPMYPGFCHSKAIVSTAGSMVGSYNYTYAARQYNHEHGILLGPGDSAQTVEDQLMARFEKASPVVYRRFPDTAGLGRG